MKPQVHCLCPVDDVQSSEMEPCACGAHGDGSEAVRQHGAARNMIHCMCLMEELDGSTKPCPCNTPANFLGRIGPIREAQPTYYPFRGAKGSRKLGESRLMK